MNTSPGQVVLSKAGRDAGRYFIITGIVDDAYVYICDGKLRRAEKPKKKKIKHLEFVGEVIDSVADKLNKSLRVNNAEIRKALEEYIGKKGKLLNGG